MYIYYKSGLNMAKFNLKENIELQRKLLGEAPLLKSKTLEYPNWKPKKPWSGQFAKFESKIKTIAKPFPAAYGDEAFYEIRLDNDYMYVYPNGKAYSTNFSKEFNYGADPKYPNAIIVLFNQDDNSVAGYITASGGVAKYNIVEPEKTEEDLTKSENPFLDGLQFVLGFVGFVPGIGDIVDIINAAISFARGNKLDGFLNLIGAIPFIGSGISATFKTLKSGKFLGRIVEAFFKTFPGFGRTGSNIVQGVTQQHMDEVWELIKNSGKFTPADMNKLATGLGDAANLIRSSAKKADFLLPDQAMRSLDDLALWLERNGLNGAEWLAKNSKVSTDGVSTLLQARKLDKVADVTKVTSWLRKIPGYKFLVNKFTMKLNPAEIAKLRSAMNVKFLQSIQSPGHIVALAKADTKILANLESEMFTVANSVFANLRRTNPTQYAQALRDLRSAQRLGGGSAAELQSLLTWTQKYSPAQFNRLRTNVAREAMDPARPNLFYNNFMNGEWTALQTYGTSPAYWAKADSYMPNLDLMNRRFLDFVPILNNELQDVGEDVKAELGIQSPDDINGLFWPLLKSAVDGAEYIGVPGVEWTRDKAKNIGKDIAALAGIHPVTSGLVSDNPEEKMSYDPSTDFVIHPDDSPVIKKKVKDKEKRITQTRSWF
jgi:hypothetical protein